MAYYDHDDEDDDQMPSGFAAIARRNLAAEDKGIEKVNAAMRATSPSPSVVTGTRVQPFLNSSRMSLDIQPDKTASQDFSLGSLPKISPLASSPVNAATRTGNGAAWRFSGFGNSLGTAYKTNPAAFQSSPAAYGKVDFSANFREIKARRIAARTRPTAAVLDEDKDEDNSDYGAQWD